MPVIRFGRHRDHKDVFPIEKHTRKEDFIYKWNEHIHNLAKLKWTLPRNYHDKLDAIMSDLSELVSLAGAEIKDE